MIIMSAFPCQWTPIYSTLLIAVWHSTIRLPHDLTQPSLTGTLKLSPTFPLRKTNSLYKCLDEGAVLLPQNNFLGMELAPKGDAHFLRFWFIMINCYSSLPPTPPYQFTLPAVIREGLSTHLPNTGHHHSFSSLSLLQVKYCISLFYCLPLSLREVIFSYIYWPCAFLLGYRALFPKCRCAHTSQCLPWTFRPFMIWSLPTSVNRLSLTDHGSEALATPSCLHALELFHASYAVLALWSALCFLLLLGNSSSELAQFPSLSSSSTPLLSKSQKIPAVAYHSTFQVTLWSSVNLF